MKWAASVVFSLVVLSVSSLTTAQTVSGRAPVVVPAQYVSSTSPTSDGRTVQTTSTPYSAQTVTIVAEPYRVPQGSQIRGAANDMAAWQTVKPRYVVAPASAVSPAATFTAAQTAPQATTGYTVSPATQPATVYYVQGTNGHVVQAPATAPSGSIYQVLGDQTEITQAPVAQCPAPAVAAPVAVAPTYPQNTIYKPVLPLRRTIDGAYVSRGIWGQPKAYMPSEPVRNFFRYMLP